MWPFCIGGAAMALALAGVLALATAPARVAPARGAEGGQGATPRNLHRITQNRFAWGACLLGAWQECSRIAPQQSPDAVREYCTASATLETRAQIGVKA